MGDEEEAGQYDGPNIGCPLVRTTEHYKEAPIKLTEYFGLFRLVIFPQGQLHDRLGGVKAVDRILPPLQTQFIL